MKDSLTLSEIIDMESQLFADRELTPVELAKRDRETALKHGVERLTRPQAVRQWLSGFPSDDAEKPGAFVERVFRWLKILFIAFGFIAGVSAASTVLSFDGTYPVNIVHFLAAFVFLQALFLILLVFNILPGAVARYVPGRNEFLKLVREFGFFMGNIFARNLPQLNSEKSRSLREVFSRMRSRYGLYRSLERWLVMGLTQRFSVAFNAGALLTCLYLVFFSDLAFAWNTTLQIESKTFHSIVSTLAAPWEALAPDAAPTEALVSNTRYFRIEGDYQTTGAITDPQAVGAWWSFLVMCLGIYGLLPRIVMLALAEGRYKYLLRRMPLDSAELDALYERMTTPIVETAPLVKEVKRKVLPHPSSPSKAMSRDKSCEVIVWGEMSIEHPQIEQLLKERFGMRALSLQEAGGFDALADEKTAANLSQNGKLEKPHPVVIFAESWEAPSKAILYFIKLLRQKLSQKRAIIIALVNPSNEGFLEPPDSTDWKIWRDALAALEDPYLRIEAATEAA